MATGIIGNDKTLINNIINAGINENEKTWELPIWDEFVEDTKSIIADLKNVDPNGKASTINGAAFLKNFIPKTKKNINTQKSQLTLVFLILL